MKNISSLLTWGILVGCLSMTVLASTVRNNVVKLYKGKKGKIELSEMVEPETSGAAKSKLLSKKNAILKGQLRAEASEEFIKQSANQKTLNRLHPVTRTRLHAALEDLEASGVTPKITSAYRSRAQQHSIYKCAQVYKCKMHRGIFGASKPGNSLHEAGLAVDLAAVAHGKRRRHLTRQGQKMVKIMQHHGFNWRYGLGDPAHFEIDPKSAGFKNQNSAIAAAERRLRTASKRDR